MSGRIDEFFLRYERANSSSDISSIGVMYANTFMFGGPNGVQTVKKEDFLGYVPKMKAHLFSMGLLETQFGAVHTYSITSTYLLATVSWKMKIRTAGGDAFIDAFATYILMESRSGELAIVFQIDHQDLASAIASLKKAP